MLYMVLHGSHQYTPFMLAYIAYMDPEIPIMKYYK